MDADNLSACLNVCSKVGGESGVWKKSKFIISVFRVMKVCFSEADKITYVL